MTYKVFPKRARKKRFKTREQRNREQETFNKLIRSNKKTQQELFNQFLKQNRNATNE